MPKTWDVSNAGQEVGTSLYTVQLYLEGDRPGAFNVCIDEFVPLTASELSVNAQTAAAGFTGARTVNEKLLQQEYDFWKANRLKDCGDGSACVPRDEGDCISEGIAPGYYKVFATASGDASWNTMANDGYTLLSNLQGKMNGLVPNWTDSSATIPSGDRGSYGPDAPRTPWRVATDYVWNGETKAVTFLDKVSTYVDGNGGIARLFNPNTTYRGGLALSGLQKPSAKAQEYTDAWLTTSIDDETYFPGTLRPIYLLLASQKFSKGCN